jgi:hypothetical protein
MLEPTIPEVTAAIRSLYADELKPLGRVILKRLREHAAAAQASSLGLSAEEVDPEEAPRIDPKQLRRLCESCQLLHVEPEEGKEYCALLKSEVFHFVDVCSPHDPYPVDLWTAFQDYLRSLCTEEEMVLPCGRYTCARTLMSRQLPFFTGCSLGQVCHIVQLAISHRRLLGYREGQLVPFLASEEWEKEQCAFQQQPFPSKKSTGSGALPVASWDETRACLWQLLSEATGLELALSNVKRLFRSNFGLELSETTLGYARLFDLLQDPRIQDVCTLHPQSRGQILVRRVTVAVPGPQRSLGGMPFVRLEAGERVPSGEPAKPFCLSTTPMVQSVPPILSFPPPRGYERNEISGEQVNLRSSYRSPSDIMGQCRVNHNFGAQVDLNSWELISPGATPWGCVDSSCSSNGTDPKCWDLVSPGASPRGCRTSSTCSSPTSGGMAGERCDSDSASTTEESSPEWSFCSASEENEFSGSDMAEAEACTVRAALCSSSLSSLLSPTMRVERGIAVKNTFIDISPQGRGLLPGSARRRTQSEPKNMASRNDAWEIACHTLLSRPRAATCLSHVKEAECDGGVVAAVSSIASSSASWADMEDGGESSTDTVEEAAEEQNESQRAGVTSTRAREVPRHAHRCRQWARHGADCAWGSWGCNSGGSSDWYSSRSSSEYWQQERRRYSYGSSYSRGAQYSSRWQATTDSHAWCGRR